MILYIAQYCKVEPFVVSCLLALNYCTNNDHYLIYAQLNSSFLGIELLANSFIYEFSNNSFSDMYIIVSNYLGFFTYRLYKLRSFVKSSPARH